MEQLLAVIKIFCYVFTVLAIMIPLSFVALACWVDHQNKKHREQADKDYDKWSV